MTKLYLIKTNAYTEVIEIDSYYKTARVLATDEVQEWATAEDLNKVEDTSSWGDDFNYDAVVEMLENEEDIEILASVDFE